MHSIQTYVETLQHLFLDCNYSRQIWNVVLGKFQIHRVACPSNVLLNWAINCRGKSFKPLLFKLCLGPSCYMYHIWIERNARIFGGNSKEAGIILATMEGDVRVRWFDIQCWSHFLTA